MIGDRRTADWRLDRRLTILRLTIWRMAIWRMAIESTITNHQAQSPITNPSITNR
jgi:hypothetical protein